jgi:hypothetical protein
LDNALRIRNWCVTLAPSWKFEDLDFNRCPKTVHGFLIYDLRIDFSRCPKVVHGFLIYGLRIDFSRCPKAVNEF